MSELAVKAKDKLSEVETKAKEKFSDVESKAKQKLSEVAGNEEHLEGPVAKAIEKQTAKLPSDFFLWSAVGSMAVSAGLQIAGRKKESLFVGQWVAPVLLLGLYNKIVKVAGSDKVTK